MRRCLYLIIAACSAVLPTGAEPPSVPKSSKKELAINLGNGSTVSLVRIEAGEFTMGSPEQDRSASPDEKPQRKVKISRPFYLGTFEVTKAQFAAFVNDTQYKTLAERSKNPHRTWRDADIEQTNDHPVVFVAWADATAFCAWMTKNREVIAAGIKEVRLPTEAEWEYACRAGTSTRYSTGDDDACLKGCANLADLSLARTDRLFRNSVPWNDGYAYTAPVGKFNPNPYRLFDMHGNVSEWCADFYGPYKDLGSVDPIRTKAERGHLDRVIRGGSWVNLPAVCRSAHRDWRSAGEGAEFHASNDVGFRVLAR